MATQDQSSSPYQSASLYVGDLHPSVTEAILFEVFKSIGPVASIRVCRDTVTRRSLGYAYVNFHTVVDAQRARDALNYTPIQGKQIRIMWSHRDPSKRKSGAGNIFIKNLDKSIDNKALYDTFSTFGSILSCKVATDEKGSSKGYGFVHYEADESAKQAITKVNGMILNGKIVFVGPFLPRGVRTPSVDPNQYTNLYVKHFPKEWSDEDLAKDMSQFGEIQSTVVRTDSEGKSLGFGFVNFENHEDAVKAVEALHGKKKFFEEAKNEAYCQRAMLKEERERFLREKFEERAEKYQGINLYVKNLDDSVDEEKLKEVFSPFGEIQSVKIMSDENGQSKGFGFVCFTTADEASKAVTQMHSAILVGKPLYVAIAERRDMRRARLQAQYATRQAFRMAQNPGGMGGVYGPVFYPQQQRQFLYGPQTVVRPRYGAQPRQGGGYRGPMRNFMVPVAQRGQPQRGGKQGGRGGRFDGERGGRFDGAQGYAGPGRGQPQAGGRKGDPAAFGPSINHSVLASASPEEQKQIIGESLFPKIRQVQPDHCSKLTGMLLESLHIPELLQLLENPELLQQRIDEGMEVLADHAQQQAPQADAEGAPQGGDAQGTLQGAPQGGDAQDATPEAT
eukprot:TRINITY_DN96_c0_g1_i1.p1 TRINITY_DN96_c0_g1~~TRINITY_DN96_c0_g1_i1.p1  ORF type:complete len:620 (-),score=123.67 TRINITY_DN96_c0_g1_i1:97-1956(-)